MAHATNSLAIRALNWCLLGLLWGCAGSLPSEPYVWRDDAPLVGVHRADVARAEGRVIEYLVSSGTIVTDEKRCGRTGRAFQVVTVETDTAYEVALALRPELCHQAPEDTTLPPNILEWPIEFAVSKKDFHIIRERGRGDPAVPMPEVAPKAEPPQPAADERTLAFTTPELNAAVGSCAGPVGLETRDSSGARAPVLKLLTVNVTATPPSAVFFADTKCTTALASVDVAAGASGAELYFRPTQLGPLQIAASSPALSGSAGQTHTVHPARAVALAFTTPPQTVAKGLCSGAVTVQARDAFDNPAAVTVVTPVQLGATPAKSISFYARADCSGSPTTRADIPAGGDSATFYFKGRRPQAVTVTAGLGTSTDSVSQDETIASPVEPPRSEPAGK